MDSCSAANSDSHDVNNVKSDSEDKFNMKECTESLLNCAEQLNSAENESDEEYSDAKDVCSDEELDLDEESIADSHKDLSDNELEVLNIICSTSESFKKSISWITSFRYTRCVYASNESLILPPCYFYTDKIVIINA